MEKVFRERLEKAKALRMKGNFSKAISLLTPLQAKLDPSQRLEQIACFNELSQCLWRMGQPAEAATKAQKALELAEETPADLRGQAAALNNLGIVSWRCGEIDSAKEYFQQSLEIRKEIGDLEAIADTLNNLGIIYWRRGELAKAEDYYQRSLDLRKQIDDSRLIAMSLTNLGIVYWQRGDPLRAEACLRQSLTLKMAIGDPQTLAESHYQLVQALIMQNSLKAASVEVQHLAELHSAAELPDVTVKFYLAKGRLEHKQRNFASALNLFEEAKTKAEEIPDFDLQIDAIRFLVQVLLLLYQFREQEIHLSLSRALINDLMELSQSKHLYGTYVESLLIQGLLNQATFDFSLAIENFRQAEQEAMKLDIQIIAQRANSELNKLQTQIEKMKGVRITSPHAYEQIKLNEVLSYLEKVRGWC